MMWLAGLMLACGLALAQAGQGVQGVQGTAAERQVLVMLHLPAPHFRPDANYGGSYDDGGHSARLRIARDLAKTHGLTLKSDWAMPALGVDCYVMEVPVGEAPERIAERLAHDPRVEWAQPMSQFHGVGHDDPLYPAQPVAKAWHLDELHRIATGRNISVAVIDSGVEATHPDLMNQIIVKENFVDGNPYAAEIHGTGVAGIIAAQADNGIGVAGVAPGARLMALRACWQVSAQSTLCNSFSLAKALDYAILHRAQVINLSLSGPQDRLVQRLLEVAMQRGIVVVGAIDSHVVDGGFPASCHGVLAVAEQESDREGQAGRLSSPGSDTVFAPGHGIPTTAPGARWNLVSGSSYAAAHVSGMMALLRELREQQVSATASGSLIASGDSHGRIDACATIARAAGTCVCACATAKATGASDYR